MEKPGSAGSTRCFLKKRKKGYLYKAYLCFKYFFPDDFVAINNDFVSTNFLVAIIVTH